MLLQGVPTSLTFTIGWVDLFIFFILLIVFLRARRAFMAVLVVVLALYIIRIFPNQIIGLVQAINNLNGPAAFITISR
jgi:hypothetical protein